jgi:hypothetical protein
MALVGGGDGDGWGTLVQFEWFPLEERRKELQQAVALVAVEVEEDDRLWLLRCLRMKGEREV